MEGRRRQGYGGKPADREKDMNAHYHHDRNDDDDDDG